MGNLEEIAVVLLVFGALALSSTPVIAHHGEAYYPAKVVTLRGTVTDFQFINPHVQIVVDVRNEKGDLEKCRPGH
jgi:hypothetical protein